MGTCHFFSSETFGQRISLWNCYQHQSYKEEKISHRLIGAVQKLILLCSVPCSEKVWGRVSRAFHVMRKRRIQISHSERCVFMQHKLGIILFGALLLSALVFS